jgi:two-component system sensor histidine kinase ChvG
VLTGGVVAVQSSSRGLVTERLAGVQQQAAIVASAIANYAIDTQDDAKPLNLAGAQSLLKELIAPTGLRARLYLPDGRLAVDTRQLLPRYVVETAALPPLDFMTRAREWLRRIYDGIMGVRPFAQLEPYYESGNYGNSYHEVKNALAGERDSAERVDSQNRLVLSVGVPVQRIKAVYGALLVTTEGGDIDAIVGQERATLFQVVLLAFAVMLVTSLYLAGTIGEPVRKLAAAADRVRFGHFSKEGGGRGEIPIFPERTDEIGDLADSLRSMTVGLYDRIDAIERFAADVAHELKNPLTSLSSALEMSQRVPEADRARLLEIARGDIKRLNRLISDISDASRLDAELSREAPEPVDLSRLLATIVDIYRMTDNPAGVKFVLRDELPPGAIVHGRDERLGQVFRNLIDNAVSFSPPGGTVTITAAPNTAMARVTVEDEGPGIPEENLESIFERFYTTERPSTDFGTDFGADPGANHGAQFGNNSGLGLSIARQVTQSAGGRVFAQNRSPADGAPDGPGGARLVVDLPLVKE